MIHENVSFLNTKRYTEAPTTSHRLLRRDGMTELIRKFSLHYKLVGR